MSVHVDLTLLCPTCGKRADMCFDHGDDWKKRERRTYRRWKQAEDEAQRRYESWLESLKDHGP